MSHDQTPAAQTPAVQIPGAPVPNPQPTQERAPGAYQPPHVTDLGQWQSVTLITSVTIVPTGGIPGAGQTW